MDEQIQLTPEQVEELKMLAMMPPTKIAFVIDGEVADVMFVDQRLAAILLSSPQIIEVTQEDIKSPAIRMTGWKYDGKNFVA